MLIKVQREVRVWAEDESTMGNDDGPVAEALERESGQKQVFADEEDLLKELVG